MSLKSNSLRLQILKTSKNPMSLVSKDTKISIKLILSELDWDPKKKIFDPILSEYFPTFGKFHLALIFGPWYIEWYIGFMF